MISAATVRVTVRISREQRLWDERKHLYLDLLREQSARWQSAGEPHQVARSGIVPEDASREERLAAHDLIDARLKAFGSRSVIHAVFDAGSTATSYSLAVLRVREQAGLEGPVEGEQEADSVVPAKTKWMAAEDRLSTLVREELTYQKYRWWHKLVVGWKRRKRPTTPGA